MPTFLAARMKTLDAAIEAHSVVRVVLRRDWEGGDVARLELLLQQDAQRQWRRVLLVSGEFGSYALATDHSLVLRQCPASQLIPIPSIVWQGGARPVAGRIAVSPDMPPLLVLDQDALAERVRACQTEGVVP